MLCSVITMRTTIRGQLMQGMSEECWEVVEGGSEWGKSSRSRFGECRRIAGQLEGLEGEEGEVEG